MELDLIDDQLIVKACPRCLKEHILTDVWRFHHPFKVGDLQYDHYAFCPEWDEPVLLMGLEESETA